jgi:hypothetical protein
LNKAYYLKIFLFKNPLSKKGKKKGQLISCPQMLTPKHTSNTERIALQM